MCNRYTTPTEAEIERFWHVGRDNPNRWWDKDVFPRGKGVFIRRAVDDADDEGSKFWVRLAACSQYSLSLSSSSLA